MQKKRWGLLALLFPLLTMAAETVPLDRVVAVINDQVITASELDTKVQFLQQQLAAQRAEIPAEPVLRKQVLQQLIDLDLQLQLAEKYNLSVDSVELSEAIEKIAQSNQLSLTQLREALVSQGMDWETYRENIRKEMLISRMQQKVVGQDIVVSNQQVDDYVKTAQHHQKTQQAFHLQNMIIPLPEEPTSEQITRARVKAQRILEKARQGQRFDELVIAESNTEFSLENGDLGVRQLAELPDVFAEKVIEMSVGEIAGPLRTGNGFQLIQLIATRQDEARHEVTKTHARHILLKPAANMTEADALKQANNLYQQLNAGQDFSVMAKRYSLDPASAVNGGDLGWVTTEELVPAFAKAMDALPLNTLSKPVKSEFGWHLIEVLERKKVDDSEAFQRQQIRNMLHQRKLTEAVQNWQQHLRTEAYVNILEQDLA